MIFSTKPSLRQKTPGRPLIVAHRGGSLEAPENTLAALRHAIEVGSDWQEVDVALTSDQEVVIIHDDTLDRTTDGFGAVADHSLEQLALLTAGAPSWSSENVSMLQGLGITELPQFEALFHAERVPKLSEALALPGANLMIELKTVKEPEALAHAVVDAVFAAKMQSQVVLASFDPRALSAVYKVSPDFALMGLVEDLPALQEFESLKIDAFGVPTAQAAEAVRWAEGRVPLWAWTVYTKQIADRMLSAGIDGVITDIPKKLIRG